MEIKKDPKKAILSIVDAIGEAHKLCGYTITPAKLTELSGQFFKILVERYPNITVEEVGQALKNGVLGDYGDFVGLSAVNLFKFVKAHQSRKMGVNCQYSAPGETPETQAPENFTTAHLIATLYDGFRKNQILAFDAESVYNYIVQNRIAIFSASKLDEYRQRAMVAIREKREFEMKMRPTEKSAIRNYLVELGNGGHEADVERTTKRTAVLDLFRQWDEDETDINQILGL